jgi:AcrR family transcriptional regulator
VSDLASRPPLKERKREQTRTRIVAAAVTLFTEHGFEAVTADAIAEAADCSRSTLFRYFGTKEDILFGDVHTRMESLRATLATLHPCADPWSVAKQVGLPELVTFLNGEPAGESAGNAAGRSALPRECLTLWFSHPAPRSRYLEISHRWEQVFAEFFAAERGVDPDHDLPSQLMATVLVGTARSVMRAYSRPDTDLHAAIDEAFALLEHGIRS